VSTEVIKCAACGKTALGTVVSHNGIMSIEGLGAGWGTVMGNQNCVFPSCSERCAREILATRVSTRFAALMKEPPRPKLVSVPPKTE